jgi:hypothetical protein
MKLIVSLGKKYFFFYWLLMLLNYINHPNKKRTTRILFGFLIYKPYYSIYLFIARYFYPVQSFLHRIYAKLKLGDHFVFPTPAGVNSDNASLFNKPFRVLQSLKIRNASNRYLFTNLEHGIVMGKVMGMDTKSFNSVWGPRAIEIYNPYIRIAYENLLVPLPTNDVYTQQADKAYIIHHWFNYYHWFTETLTRLWEVEKLSTPSTVLLPAALQKFSYVTDTLPVFKNITIEWIPEQNNIVKLKQAHLVDCKRSCDDYNPTFLNEFKGRYLSHIKTNNLIDEAQLQPGNKLLILRKKATRRNIVNEAEVVHVCKKYGITPIDFEDYTLPQQAYIVSNAKLLVGLHGAGLTNMVFMSDNATILELQREVTGDDKMFSTVYYTMANALGYTYHIQFCKPEEGKTFFDTNYTVDTAVLDQKLSLINVA